MTIISPARPAHTRTRNSAHWQQVAQRAYAHAVLFIDRLPRHLRMDVETAMVEHLPSDALPAAPGTDVLEAQWFTRWERSDVPGCVRCRQVLTAPAEELARFRTALADIAPTATVGLTAC